MSIVLAPEALQRLKDGNARFVANDLEHDDIADAQKRSKLVAGQYPFATILGCSDSRVPVELVFDQGLGDLFVVRVAGNVVAPSGIGSVEFASLQFGVQLVVVLGHSKCGAVMATVDALNDPDSEHSKNISAIVDRVKPAVEPVVQDGGQQGDTLIKECVRANVRRSVEQLKESSSVLQKLMDDGKLTIVGAEYSLETGEVEFL
jgi:carbonic anhydrase